MKYHAWTAKGHDFANFLPHFRFVALYRASVAGSFMLVWTGICFCEGVIYDFFALCTQWFISLFYMVMATAIYLRHGHNGFVVSFESA